MVAGGVVVAAVLAVVEVYNSSNSCFTTKRTQFGFFQKSACFTALKLHKVSINQHPLSSFEECTQTKTVRKSLSYISNPTINQKGLFGYKGLPKVCQGWIELFWKNWRDLESRNFLSIHSIQIAEYFHSPGDFAMDYLCLSSAMVGYTNQKPVEHVELKGHNQNTHTVNTWNNCDSSVEKKPQCAFPESQTHIAHVLQAMADWRTPCNTVPLKQLARGVFPWSVKVSHALQLGLENLSTMAVLFLICNKAE